MPINLNGPSFSTAGLSTGSSVSTSIERVSSGKQINSAIDGAAGLSIASRLSAQVEGLDVASRNASDAISLTQVADGALSNINANLLRIRELTLQATNGTLNDSDRQGLAAEADQLSLDNQNILNNASFNGINLFSNNSDLNFQIGPNTGDQLSIGGLNLKQELEDLGLNNIDLRTQNGAINALATIDNASEKVLSRSSEFGAAANSILSTVDALETARTNALATRSRTEDADLAKELSKLSAGLIQEQAQIAVQAQANVQEAFVLQLRQ